MRAHRSHQAYWAFVGHRLSGIALAAFLPLHFLTLALVLKGTAALDEFLVLAEMPLFKLAEWGLVVLLAVHFFFGLRLLFLELHPWKRAGDSRLSWIVPSVFAAFLVGAVFVVGVV